MARRIVRISAAAAALLVLLGAVAPALGQSAPVVVERTDFTQFLAQVVKVLVFCFLGLLVLLVGFRALDMATPFSLNKEIAEDDNTAAGVVVAGLMIALGLIIHGALTSTF